MPTFIMGWAQHVGAGCFAETWSVFPQAAHLYKVSLAAISTSQKNEPRRARQPVGKESPKGRTRNSMQLPCPVPSEILKIRTWRAGLADDPDRNSLARGHSENIT